MAQEEEKQIRVRNVWASNLIMECDHIKNNLGRCSLASIKCKYPTHCAMDFFNKNNKSATSELVYDFLKLHIGNFPIIQLGFTLFNWKQKLPVVEGHPSIWAFHFNMSDSNYCPKTLSDAFLERLNLRGLNLEVYKKDGIDPEIFRDVLIGTGIIWGEPRVEVWFSLLGIEDFVYLVKIFMENHILPETFEGFSEMARRFLGLASNTWKLAEKMGINYTSFKGVIRDVAVVRPVAESEEGNVGFESHFVMQIIMELKNRYISTMKHSAGKF